jgi:hypothetical protein
MEYYFVGHHESNRTKKDAYLVFLGFLFFFWFRGFLGFGGFFLFFLLFFLSFGSSGFSFFANFHLVAKFEGSNNGGKFRLVDASQEPSVGVDESLSEVGVQDSGVQVVHSQGEGNISQRNSLSNQEGSGLEVRVELFQRFSNITLSLLDGIRVVGDQSQNWENPNRGRERKIVSKVNPRFDLCGFVFIGSIENFSLFCN